MERRGEEGEKKGRGLICIEQREKVRHSVDGRRTIAGRIVQREHEGLMLETGKINQTD